MRYFTNTANHQTYGYDDNDQSQSSLIVEALAANWVEVTGNWPPPADTPSPQHAADVELNRRLALGITVTGNAAITGTYALDAVSIDQIFKMGMYASQFGTFPSGLSTQLYPDITGLPQNTKQFSVDQFVSFLRAVGPLDSALVSQAAVMANGGTPVWPSQTANIP